MDEPAVHGGDAKNDDYDDVDHHVGDNGNGEGGDDDDEGDEDLRNLTSRPQQTK